MHVVLTETNKVSLNSDERHSLFLFQALEAVGEVGDLLQLKYSRREQPRPSLGWMSEESLLQDWSPSYLTLPLLPVFKCLIISVVFLFFFVSDEPLSPLSRFPSFSLRFSSTHSCSGWQLIHSYPGRMFVLLQTVSRALTLFRSSSLIPAFSLCNKTQNPQK